MSHNFQEVIDELHRGRDLLTSTSGTQGRLNDLSAALSTVCSRVSTYCSDAAQDAAENLAAAQGAIDNLRHCISGYSDANEELIERIIGNSASIPNSKGNTENASSTSNSTAADTSSEINSGKENEDKVQLLKLLRQEAEKQEAEERRQRRVDKEIKFSVNKSNGKDYDSNLAKYPGDYPPHTPPNENGIKYQNRSDKDTKWKQYQEQISGWNRTDDGKIPEYVVPRAEGRDVAFDGHTVRGMPPTEIFLEAKHGHKGLLYYAEKNWSQKAQDNIIAQVERQLSVLPKNAQLEWHVSSKEGTQAISLLFISKQIYSVKVIFTEFK